MKKFLSVLALLMAAIMIVMSFAACGDGKASSSSSSDSSSDNGDIITDNKPDAEATIIGAWCYTLDFAKLIEANKNEILTTTTDDQQKEFYEEMFKAYDGVTMDYIMEFIDDTNYKSYVDQTSLDAAMTKLKANLKAQLPAMFAVMGITEEQLEEELSAQGMTLDAYVDALFEQMDVDSAFEGSDTEGVYRYEDDRLYTSDDSGEIKEDQYVVATLSGDTLTVTEVVGSDEDSKIFVDDMLPMVFNRK